MNQEYDLLAPFYDAFQSNEDPSSWAKFIKETFFREAKAEALSEPQGRGGSFLACDLGCGTGRVSRELGRLGFDVIGIDNSENMLSEARNADDAEMDAAEDAREALPPLYLLQDLTEFELYGTVNMFCATLDTMNHLEPADLKKVLRLAHNYLHPGGILLFDLLTHDYMAEKMGHELYYEIGADRAVLWQNDYSETEQVNRADITIFLAQGARGAQGAQGVQGVQGALYQRTDLEIKECYHAPSEVIKLLEEIGFTAREIRPTAADHVDPQGNRHFIVAGRAALAEA